MREEGSEDPKLVKKPISRKEAEDVEVSVPSKG
jgi:hypothetical protein